MNTFRILARLWYFTQTPRHPLIRYELRRVPRWEVYSRPFRRAYRRLIQVSVGFLIVAALMELGNVSRVSVLLFALTIFIPLFGLILASAALIGMILWSIPVALAGSAVIVQERVAQTWPLLLVTPMPRTDLLLAKLAVGIARQQTFITIAMVLQTVPLLIEVSLLNNLIRGQSGALPALTLAFVTALFVIERLQTLVLAGLMGLGASLVAETWSWATIGAVALGLLTWIVRMLITYGLCVAVAGGKVVDAIAVVMVGLPYSAVAGRTVALGVVTLSGALVVQEVIVRLVLRGLVRRLPG